MKTINKIRADGGKIWIPKITPHKITEQENRNLIIASILLPVFLLAIFVVFFITAHANYVTTKENVVTVTSYKLSFYATIVFFFTVTVPIISAIVIVLLNMTNDIPLHLTWKELKKGTQFEDASYLIGIMTMFTIVLGLFMCFLSAEMMPFGKSYDYTDPNTGKTVELHVRPYTEVATIDPDIANVIDPKTGEIDKTQELSVKISDLNVTPFKSTYTITHEPLDNIKTVPPEEQLNFTEIAPNPGEKVKIFENGTYEIVKIE